MTSHLPILSHFSFFLFFFISPFPKLQNRWKSKHRNRYLWFVYRHNSILTTWNVTFSSIFFLQKDWTTAIFPATDIEAFVRMQCVFPLFPLFLDHKRTIFVKITSWEEAESSWFASWHTFRKIAATWVAGIRRFVRDDRSPLPKRRTNTATLAIEYN